MPDDGFQMPDQHPSGSELARAWGSESQPEHLAGLVEPFDEFVDTSRLDSTAEVDVAPERVLQITMGGDFGRVDRARVPGRSVAQDGTAPTMLYRNAAALERVRKGAVVCVIAKLKKTVPVSGRMLPAAI